MQYNKKALNLIGISLLTILIMTVALQFICRLIINMLSEGILFQIVSCAGVNIGTLIVIAPVIALMLRKLPVEVSEARKSINLLNIVLFVIMGLGIILLTNLLKMTVFGFRQSVIVQPQEFSLFWLLSGIIAAVAEEILFRKIILNRLKPFGKKEAIFISALAFGLCHINFWSFTFAFALGLLFGQITVYTNTIRYSCVLHAVNNILTVSLLPYFFGKISETAINIICISLIILGVALLLKRKYILSLVKSENGIGVKTVLKRPGMITFFVISGGIVLISFVSGFFTV